MSADGKISWRQLREFADVDLTKSFILSWHIEGEEVTEITEKLSHGAISDLSVLDDGQYAISGEFGTVSVVAERPILRLKGP
jgi:hypothetical protein